VLIHLVDASSAHVDDHIAAVHKILDDLNLSAIPRLLVFNKSDLLSKEGLENMKLGYDAIFISALNQQSLLPLSRRVSEMLEGTANPQALSLERDEDLHTPVRAVS